MSRKEEIEARKLEIRKEVENAETTEQVEELDKEVDALNEESKQIAEQEEEKSISDEMEKRSIEVKELKKVEEKSMKEEMKEIRNSKKYIDAYAEYIKSGLVKDYEISEEQRSLLTTNAENGVVAVPDMVDEIIRTAWEREELMKLVRSINVPGNFKVQFEVSGDPAVEHAEGSGAVEEENLILGIVTLTPKSIKKWISVSDEALDMRGEAFLNYIYDELTYRIAKKNADVLVAKIAALPQSLTPNEEGIYDTVSANKVAAAPALGTVATAVGNLSDEANKPVIIMNKLTEVEFKKAQYAGNYSVDPFEGLKVVHNNTLPAYNTASVGAVYAIVGDVEIGALANYPKGDGIELKYDDKTLMTQDLVRILGRRYGAVEAVADKAFVLITKPETV